MINSWDELHEAYKMEGEIYPSKKSQHALASLLEIENINAEKINLKKLNQWLDKSVKIASSITGKISASRKKDYVNPFRKMIYDSETEMNNVIGEFDRNSFVCLQQKELCSFMKNVEKIRSKFTVGTVK